MLRLPYVNCLIFDNVLIVVIVYLSCLRFKDFLLKHFDSPQVAILFTCQKCCFTLIVVVSGGAMVLSKLAVPGRPTNLDNCRARAYCACSICGWGLFGHFFSRLLFLCSFSLSLSLGETARYKLEYWLKAP